MKALIYMSHLFFENVLQEYACIGVEGFLGPKRIFEHRGGKENKICGLGAYTLHGWLHAYLPPHPIADWGVMVIKILSNH